MLTAMDAGSAVLRRGGSSLDAVEAAIRVLEDDPLFNAGRGAVFTADGRNELDASIMDGATRKAGAVAGVTRTRNPISLARAVMEKSPHVMLAREGADQFSVEQGLPQVDPGYFRTEQRWQQLLDWRRDNAKLLDPTHSRGTVGAVAIDVNGHVAAGTSTGGMTGKRWGRVGDSPVIGAGTYAADGNCAVSATGSGEFFIRTSAARQLCDRIAWRGDSVQAAASATIADIGGHRRRRRRDRDGRQGPHRIRDELERHVSRLGDQRARPRRRLSTPARVGPFASACSDEAAPRASTRASGASGYR